MIVEERIYRIATGRLNDYLGLYQRLGLEVQTRILGNLIGYFTTEFGQLSTAIHWWGYADLADREARRAALAREPSWQTYLTQCTPLIESMDNRILVPTGFSPLR